ncbi:hypothetical protein BBP40_004634 [Aspergillus hancockii]|nr:hypothetical protein BBP40_004634 [Aspergillus hancockii]
MGTSSGDLAQRRGSEVGISEPYAENQNNDGFEMSRLHSLAQNEPSESVVGEDKSRGNWRIAAIMLALSLSLFISALDQTIVATATPTISAELHSGSGYVWIGGAYLIANAASSNIWANLSDIWGRKPILLSAVALFFGASIICAKAVDMPMLIAGRGVQGIAGGGLLQLITITISDLFSVRLRGLFLGLIEFIWAIAGALGPIVGGAFTQSVSWSEKRLAKYPLMPLGIFKKWSNVACFIVAFTHGFAFLGQEYYLPLFYQSAKEASPFHSGILILPFVLSEAATSLIAGLIIHRTGRYLEIVWAGTALVVLGSGLFINFGATSSLAKIICFQLVAGGGCGLLFFPPLLALQSNVPQDETAAATATFGFIRNLAMAMSVVLGGVVFQNSMDMRQSKLLAAGLSGSMVEELTGAEASANVMVIQSIEDALQRSVVKDAYAWSLRNVWILYTCLGACGLIASAFITRQHLSKEHVETKTGLKEKQPLTEARQDESVSEP